MLSRSPRRTPPGRCHRHARGDGTSRRVWCRHVWLAPGPGNHVRTRHRRLAALGSHGGKTRKNPLLGSVCLLTRRGRIRVRLGMSNHPRVNIPVAPMQRAPV
jgi:hypothetical protein